jgi:hypothetical protein
MQEPNMVKQQRRNNETWGTALRRYLAARAFLRRDAIAPDPAQPPIPPEMPPHPSPDEMPPAVDDPPGVPAPPPLRDPPAAPPRAHTASTAGLGSNDAVHQVKLRHRRGR